MICTHIMLTNSLTQEVRDTQKGFSVQWCLSPLWICTWMVVMIWTAGARNHLMLTCKCLAPRLVGQMLGYLGLFTMPHHELQDFTQNGNWISGKQAFRRTNPEARSPLLTYLVSRVMHHHFYSIACLPESH
jgi:hypothetical protein